MSKILQRITSTGLFFKRYKFIYFVALMGVLVVSAFKTRPDKAPSFEEAAAQIPPNNQPIMDAEGTAKLNKQYGVMDLTDLADSLISFALSLEGKPYLYGGESPSGFDCSGFVYHVFKNFGFELNRSSRTQATQGRAVNIEEAQKGDLLFFTGTNPKKRTVGHVGIVISAPGEELRFVHSSSNGGVKISELQGYYQTRYMHAKRLLGVE